MLLSNRNKAGIYSFLNSLVLMTAIAGIIGFLLERYKFNVLGWQSWLFLAVPLIVIYSFYFAGRQIFEYDSDGEALNFKNRNVIPFLNKPASDEFPKYKLLKYDIVNVLFFKRLYITINSKKNHQITLKYDISFLTKKEIADLKYSLSKVIKANKENNREN